MKLLAGAACLALASAHANARGTTRRRLLDTESEATICSVSASGQCELNSDVTSTLGAFADLSSAEQAFTACFNEAMPLSPCPGSTTGTIGEAAGVIPSPAEAPAQPLPADAPAEAPAQAPAVAPMSGVPADALTDLSVASILEPVAQVGDVEVPLWTEGASPDYSVPSQCPYGGRINPLSAGSLPEEFVHQTNTAFVPFSPDDTELIDGEICHDDGANELTEHGRGQVLIKDPDTGLCTSCPEAKCTVWVPDPTGNYQPHCTGVAVLNDLAMFDLKFPMPGNERAAAWGPDANPHVHFQCTGCGGAFWNKYMPFENPNYCADTLGDKSMLMSAPDASNAMNSVKLGQGEPGTFFLIMTDDWQMPSAGASTSPCFANKWANPCPAYAVAEGTDCSATVGPDPEPDFSAVIMPEPLDEDDLTEACTIAGYEFPPDDAADGFVAASVEECAALCVEADDCDGAVYLQRAVDSVQPSCYLWSDIVDDDDMTLLPQLSDLPVTTILLQPCADVMFAAPAAIGRRLAQAADASTCVDAAVTNANTVCASPAALQPMPAAGFETTEDVFTAAQPLLTDPAAFKTRCPLAELSAGTATMECSDDWTAYFAALGCGSCLSAMDELDMAAMTCGSATVVPPAACTETASIAVTTATPAGSSSTLAWPAPVAAATGGATGAATGGATGATGAETAAGTGAPGATGGAAGAPGADAASAGTADGAAAGADSGAAVGGAGNTAVNATAADPEAVDDSGTDRGLVTGDGTLSSPAEQAAASPDSDGGLQAWHIAVIVAGAVVLAAAAGLLVAGLRRRENAAAARDPDMRSSGHLSQGAK